MCLYEEKMSKLILIKFLIFFENIWKILEIIEPFLLNKCDRNNANIVLIKGNGNNADIAIKKGSIILTSDTFIYLLFTLF